MYWPTLADAAACNAPVLPAVLWFPPFAPPSDPKRGNQRRKMFTCSERAYRLTGIGEDVFPG